MYTLLGTLGTLIMRPLPPDKCGKSDNVIHKHKQNNHKNEYGVQYENHQEIQGPPLKASK